MTNRKPVVTPHKERRAALHGGTWPERTVMRSVKWAELNCGHDIYRLRKPRVGAVVVCEQCARESSHAR